MCMQFQQRKGGKPTWYYRVCQYQDSCYLPWWFVLIRHACLSSSKRVPSQTLSLETVKVAGLIPSYFLSGLRSLLRTFLQQDLFLCLGWPQLTHLIEMACANDVTLLCLPVHTSHILQPLDVGMFKSSKPALIKHVATTWGNILVESSPLMSSHRWHPKHIQPLYSCERPKWLQQGGMFPFNPSEVNDRQLVPSSVFQTEKSIPTGTADEASCSSLSEKAGETPPGSSLFSPE